MESCLTNRQHAYRISKLPDRIESNMPRALVTTGTTRFFGLLTAADALAQSHSDWDFRFQTGPADFTPQRGEHFEFSHSIEKEYQQADLIISHAGAGTLFKLATLGKPCIAVPNLERADHHQLELAEYFQEQGYCLLAKTPADLASAFDAAPEFEPQAFSESAFDALAFGEATGIRKATKVHILATEGGHLAQARLLAERLRGSGLSSDVRIFSDGAATQAWSELQHPLPHFSGKELSPLARILPLLRSSFGREARRMLSQAASGDLLIVLGAGGCIPAALLGRIRGKKLVVLESRSRVRNRSLTYRMLAPLTQYRLRQYPQKGSRCFGVIY
jgi:beta-1,4-N-acetylglucosaminyltransferase